MRKDPNSAGTEADIEAQTKVLFDLRRDLEQRRSDLVNQIEIVRGQICRRCPT